MDDPDSSVIGAFWRMFERCAPTLARLQTADEAAYDEALEALQRIHPGLWLEFASDPTHELIVTAHGDRSLFSLAEAVVAAAPPLPRWHIVALKPKLGFPHQAERGGTRVCIADVHFQPLSRPGSNGLGLRLLLPDLNPGEADAIHNALLNALDHALGERTFAESIAHTEVRPLHEPAATFFPLLDLERYLASRQRSDDSAT